jgi:hypothetical protein
VLGHPGRSLLAAAGGLVLDVLIRPCGIAVRGLGVSADFRPDGRRHGERGMPAVIDLLHRFRRLGGPPGAPASGIGVPGRPGETAAGELGPVFALVDAIELEAADLRITAEGGAAKIVADAGSEAARIRADGHLRAETERAQIAATRAAAADSEQATARADAEREAARIDAASAERIDELARGIVSRLGGMS